MLESFKTIPESETVYLSLGSNLGAREQNLCRAVKFLSESVKIRRISKVYDTAPMGNTEQSRFLNLVCEIVTSLSPIALLALVKSIEVGMGRAPAPVNSPRPVDIDILLYGQQVLSSSGLVVPHPRLAERAFVLVPLAEIAPDLGHPIIGKTIRELLGELKRYPRDVVRWVGRLRGNYV